jgi:uncharacterized repeat protein (TIGR01451 family)
MKFVSIVLIICAILLVIQVNATTIKSDFSVKSGTNKATLTCYSYLKEPILQETNFIRGYKAGSMTYLKNGTIDFSDKMSYYDGAIDAEHTLTDYERGDVDINSTYRNDYVINNFQGERAISEIFAKGFFPSNRAISAWKKIRYTDLSYDISDRTGKYYDSIDTSLNKMQSKRYSIGGGYPGYPNREYGRTTGDYDLGESYLSSYVNVLANATMGPHISSEGEYDFRWQADVTNGEVEIKDSTGWTNRTGARRIDWEREALLQGDVNATNTLAAKGLFYPGAGGEKDWLPCAYSSEQPPIQNRYSALMLKPNLMLPQKKTPTPECLGNCSKIFDTTGFSAASSSSAKSITLVQPGLQSPANAMAPKSSANFENCATACSSAKSVNDYSACVDNCTKLYCVQGNCPGFEGIYTYDEGDQYEDISGPRTTVKTKEISQTQAINIVKEIYSIKNSSGQELMKSSIPISNKLDYLKTYKPSKGDYLIYRIVITHNDGINSLKRINVTDILPKNIHFPPNNAEIQLFGRTAGVQLDLSPDLKELRPIDIRIGRTDKEIILDVKDELKPNVGARIYINTTLDAIPANIYENRAYARGEFENATMRIGATSDVVQTKKP